jgi:SAM-dependent methyltransferase
MNDSSDNFEQAVAHKAVVEKLWSEPLFEACRDLLPTPEGATVLVAEARCGYVPLQLVEMLEDDTRVIALDSHGSMLDLARKRAEGGDAEDRIYFVAQHVNNLSYADDVFQAGVCMAGLQTGRQAKEGIAELARVTSNGGKVVVAAPLGTSFPEFYDLLDEALRSHGMPEVLPRVERMGRSLLSPGSLGHIANESELTDVSVEKLSWKLGFDGGRDFLHSPLVRETFFPHWLGLIRSSDREPILRYISDAIDTYWHGKRFETSIEAAVVVGTAL